MNALILAYIQALTPLVAAVAWPAGALLLVFWFRKPLRDALGRIAKLKVPGVEIELSATRAALEVSSSALESIIDTTPAEMATGSASPRIPLREYFAQRVEENPLNAIIEAYIAVEQWYDKALTEHGIDNFDGTRKRSAQEMAVIAVQVDLIPQDSLTQIQKLGFLRDLAVSGQGRESTSVTGAKDYLLLADGVILALDGELERSDRRGWKLDASKLS